MKDPRKVLIVDDDHNVRSILESVLSQAGYEARSASCGEQAIKLVANEKFHLVITDLIMPGSDGIETILSLRAAHPHLKIIAMSGGGTDGARNYLPLAATLGARYTLNKPFRMEELLSVVGKEIGFVNTGTALPA